MGAAVLLLAAAVAAVAVLTGPGAGAPTTAAPVAPRVARIAGHPLPVTMDHPAGIALTPDGGHAWVAANGTDQAPGSQVQEVELPSGRIQSSVTLPGRPYDVASSPDGRTLYATVTGSDPTHDDVAFVDLAARAVTATVPVGQNPSSLAVSADGRTVWVANSGYSDIPSQDITVIDTTTRTAARTVRVGPAPGYVTLSPDGRTVYASVSGNQPAGTTVAAVDTASGGITRSLTVGEGPLGLRTSPDGRTLYVASSVVTPQDSGSIAVVDVATGAVRTTLRDPGTAPTALVISPDGSRVVTVTGTANPAATTPDSVAVVDTARNAIVATTRIGKGAREAAFGPDGREVYVGTDTGLWVVDVP